MAVCFACGTDNRDKAKFCRGCARALTPLPDTPLPDAPASGPVQVCATCQTTNPLAATVCKSCRTSLVPDLAAAATPLAPAPTSRGIPAAWWLAGLVLLVAAGAWLGLRQPGPASPATPGPIPAASAEPAAPAVDAVAPAPRPAPSPVAEPSQRASELRRLAALEKKRQQAAREQVAALERERAARAEAQQRAERAALQKAAQESAERAAAIKTALPPPLPLPAPVKTVEQTCASSGNFLAREVCRLQTCRDATLANDPVCVRFRQIEAANRREPTN